MSEQHNMYIYKLYMCANNEKKKRGKERKLWNMVKTHLLVK